MTQRFVSIALTGALLAAAILGCKRDDDVQPETNATKIIGSWKEVYRAVDSNRNGKADTAERMMTSYYRVVTFYTNGSVRDTSFANGIASSIEASYTVTEDIVNITFPGIPATRILNLDATNLVWKDTSRTPPLLTAFVRK